MEPAFRFIRYDALQPEIVALGSSRVLQFRQSHFTRPFVNMGMSVDYAVLPNIARALTTKGGRGGAVQAMMSSGPRADAGRAG